MAHMQEAGIAAGVVQNAKDIYEDPQFRQREFFWVMNHKEMGEFTHLGEPAVLSKTPAKPRTCRHPAWASTRSMSARNSWVWATKNLLNT